MNTRPSNLREYGAAGRIGIGTPQGNPTVEPEFHSLLPADVAAYTARLCSTERRAVDRLRAYLLDLGTTLDQFDVLSLDAFGFACTASSYLVGAEREQEIVQELRETRGYPIFTAARAIGADLRVLEAESIVILAPYPTEITDAASAYWESVGFNVLNLHRIEIGSADTRAIYELSGQDAIGALEGLLAAHRTTTPDAYVFTGTGMPTLSILSHAFELTGRPVLSSNMCLARQALGHIGQSVRRG